MLCVTLKMQARTFCQGVLAVSLLFFGCVTAWSGNCQFRRHLCGYSRQDGSGVTWNRHTDLLGYMEIAKSVHARDGTKAKLVSPFLPSSTKCVKFLYLMWPDKIARFRQHFVGKNIGTLNVYIKALGSNSLRKVWSISDTQYVQYLHGQVPLHVNSKKRFQVVFEYISSGYKFPNARIRVASISMFSSSYCGIYPLKAKAKSSDFCSFDNGTCGYINKHPSLGTSWGLRRTATHKGFPVRDHTSGSGSFMYASTSWSRGDRLSIAELISPPMWNAGCVQFYYYKTFHSGGRLDVLTQIGSKTSLVWTVESSDESRWKFASIPITSKSSESVKIIFQADSPNSRGLSALIDDIKVTSDARSCKLYPAQPKDRLFKEVQGSCNFDASMCGYQTNNYVWKRRAGGSESRSKPKYDHTFNHGMYIHAQMTYLRRGAKSRLVSPILTNVQCVTFYYYMYGKNVGELNVYTRVQNTDTHVLKLSGYYGKEWKKAVIYLDKITAHTSFRLIFESVKGTGDGGNIAIDDISTSTNCRRPTTLKPTGNTTMVRLVNGDHLYGYSMHEARVEVFHDGKWGTICDKSWSIEDATVVCKMLGFTGAEKAIKEARCGSGAGEIWLNDVQCTGQEKSISECRHAGWGVNNCLHNQDAGVICQSDYNDVAQHGTCVFDSNPCGYTIENKTQSGVAWTKRTGNFGYMEIVTNSSVKAGATTTFTSPILQSSTKCVDFSYLMSPADFYNRNLYSSDIGTLNVYIKTLGSNSLRKVWSLSGPQYMEFLGGQAPLNVNSKEQFQVVFEYISGENPKVFIIVDSIKMFNRSCDILPFKAIPDVNDVKLRLRGGKSNMEGRIEIYVDGEWGTVRDGGWDLGIGMVACRQLKFAGAVGVYHGSAFGQAIVNGSVWTTASHIYPMCKSSETNIGRCLASKSLRIVPSSNFDAGVECFDARLVGGKSPNEGRVEINYKGKWGTVCNKGWNIKSANVICRDLGYRRAKALSFFGKGKGEIRLSDVKCKGNEVSIASCLYRGWIVDYCDHSQDVGVVCTNEKPK